MINRGNLAILSRVVGKGKFPSLLGWTTSFSLSLLPATWKQPDVCLFAPNLPRVFVSDCDYTSLSFVHPTFIMKPARNSKDNKSDQRSSTAPQGKAPSGSLGTSKTKTKLRLRIMTPPLTSLRTSLTPMNPRRLGGAKEPKPASNGAARIFCVALKLGV